jgi:predicted Ser/Thr protein kinase
MLLEMDKTKKAMIILNDILVVIDFDNANVNPDLN